MPPKKSQKKDSVKYNNLSQIAKSLPLSNTGYNLEDPEELKKLIKKKEEYLSSKLDAINSAIEKTNITLYNHDCIRKRSNWTKRIKNDIYNFVDNPTTHELVSHDEFLENLKFLSPKLDKLLKKINELDEKDMREHRKKFKHFIFCDVKTGTYGTKMIASGLIASGMKIANIADNRNKKVEKSVENGLVVIPRDSDQNEDDYETEDEDVHDGGAKKKKISYNKMYILPDSELKKTRGNNFFVLNSTKLYDRPVPVIIKKQILAKFNERPDNIYGENARIIVMDSGYKEGIDLFDIKYVHIFEPSVTLSDQKQVIGRGTRTCGQRGLKFHPTKGWPLHVFVYDMEIPNKLRSPMLNSENAFEFYMKALNLDARLFKFSEELEDATIYGSVDYELNKNIHNFSIGKSASSSTPSPTGGATISLNGGESGAIECGKGTKKRCPRGKRCNNTLKKCAPYKKNEKNAKKEEKENSECGLWEGKRCSPGKRCNNEKHKCEHKRDSAGNYMYGPHGTAIREQTLPSHLSPSHLSPSPLPPHIVEAVEAIASPSAEEEEERRMGHKEMREYINDNYSQYKWDKLKMENLCGSAPESTNPNDEAREGAMVAVREMSGGAAEILKYSPSQDFIRNFFTSNNPMKGMLLWNSVGTGKTCAAIAAATHTFERDGYTILWVTRTTLKNDIWKNMFQQVCHEIIREKIEAGLEIPDRQDARMKLLSKSWKIRPMSYKQFSNLVSKENRFYDDLVKINGSVDPLRKTLLIIDEAHKLYGGGDLSSLERPDMTALCAAVDKSYEISGRDSVKLLLMTATPITNDPMELVKLINMFKPIGQKMPSNFDDFSDMYLDEDGKFTEKGREKYLDDIAGYVSYLNREKDARQFAQPHIERVYTPIADVDEVIETDKPVQARVYKEAIQDLRKEISTNTDIIEKEFGKITKKQILNELIQVCGNVDDTKEKKLCEKIARSGATELMMALKEEMKAMKEHIKELRVKIKELLLEKKAKYEKLKGSRMNIEKYKEFSIYYNINKKCNKKLLSEKGLAEYMNESQQFTELNDEINENNERIKEALDELKTYMVAYNLKMKELKRALKTGNFTNEEKAAIGMTIKNNKMKHKETLKELREDVKDRVSSYKMNIQRINKDKKIRVQTLKKNIKNELLRYKRQNTSLKRIKKQMLSNIQKKMKKDGIDIGQMSDKVRNIVEDYKNQISEKIEKEKEMAGEKAAEKAAEKARKEAEKAAEKAKKAAEKEAEKARKDAEKAAEKARKEAEKAAKKAEKEAAKTKRAAGKKSGGRRTRRTH